MSTLSILPRRPGGMAAAPGRADDRRTTTATWSWFGAVVAAVTAAFCASEDPACGVRVGIRHRDDPRRERHGGSGSAPSSQGAVRAEQALWR